MICDADQRFLPAEMESLAGKACASGCFSLCDTGPRRINESD